MATTICLLALVVAPVAGADTPNDPHDGMVECENGSWVWDRQRCPFDDGPFKFPGGSGGKCNGLLCKIPGLGGILGKLPGVGGLLGMVITLEIG